MTRTLRTPTERAATNGHVGVAERPSYSLAGPTRRRPSWVLFGSLLVVIAALVGAWVFAATSDRISVVIAASNIQPGDVIDVGDLRVIEIGRSAEMRAIQPSDQDLILGRAARGPIPAGTVLNTDLFAESGAAIPVGMVVAGVELSPGQAPVPRLRAGDAVAVLGVRRTTAAPAAAEADPLARLITDATVWAVEDHSTGSTTRLWVSLLIPIDAQEAVTQAAADGLLRLTLKGAGG